MAAHADGEDPALRLQFVDVDGVEVAGCVEEDDAVEVVDDGDAAFWTVYLRRGGLAHAEWDLRSRAAAENVARAVQRYLR